MDARVQELLPIIEGFGLTAPTIDEARSRFHETASQIPPPDGVEIEPTTLAGLTAIRVRSEGGATGGRLLYLHGGGFVIGSVEVQTSMPAALALATGCEVVAVEYRLAPEHPCPAATDDAVAAHEALRAEGEPIVALAGDSAGASLCVLTAVALRDQGLPLPGALVCFSPWTDLAGRSARSQDPGVTDAVLPRRFLEMAASAYLAGRPPDDPAANPATADLRGLPPAQVHVGGDELLLEDSVGLVQALAMAGVEAALHVWPGMIHVFPAYPSLNPERDRALGEAAALVGRRP